MKKYIEIINYIILFCIVLTFKSFSYNKSRVDSYDSPTSTGYSDANSDIVYNQLMNLKDVKVKFTQDDDKYYFTITANSSVKIYGDLFSSSDSSWASGIEPILYKENNFSSNIKITESVKVPHYDRTAGNFYERSKVTINNKTQSDYDYSYRLSSGAPVVTNNTTDKNGELYYIPKGLRTKAHKNDDILKYATSYPINSANNGTGVSIDRNSSSSYFSMNGSCYDTYYANINVSISINKNYFDHYRYVCFAHTLAVTEYDSFSDTSLSCTGLSLSSDAIDLKEHADCEHNWTYKSKDKFSHTIYCDKCEWEKEEAHSLLYEYDGFKNNVCTCSYIDKVRYVFDINDDMTSKIEEVCDTESAYNKHPFTYKTGYNFKWYEKYEKLYADYNNLSTVSNAILTIFVSTTSEIDDVAGNHSVNYIAKYFPIKYTFNYSDVNDYNLKSDEKIEPQVVYYDEIAKLKKATDFRGYTFKGWSLDKKSKSIDFDDLEDVTNYTTIDLKEFDLYPIYERLDYNIVYSAGPYSYESGQKEKSVHYNFFDEGELEKPYINSNDVTFEGYVDENGNKYKRLSDVQNVIEKMKKANATLHLKVSVGSVGIGRSEHTIKETTTPINNWVETKALEVPPTDFYHLYETNQSAYNRNIVSGMSDTNKEIVEEETGESGEDKPGVATTSFINKLNIDNDNMKKNKFALLREFIESNKFLCIVSSVLFIIFLIIYEVLLIRRFLNRDGEKLSYQGV